MSSTFDQHCGQCGYLLPPGNTTCPNCGAPVSTSQPGEATPSSQTPSEYFPGLANQVDSEETLVRLRPEAGVSNQPSGEGFPSSPTPFSPTPSSPMPSNPTPSSPIPASPPQGSGPTAPQQVPFPVNVPPPAGPAPWPGQPQTFSGMVAPQQGQAPWPGQPQNFSGALPPTQQPFGVQPPQPGWGTSPTGPLPAGPNTFTYPGQPGPGGQPISEGFGGPPSGAYGTGTMPGVPGAYTPGYGMPPGGTMMSVAPQRPLPRWFLWGAAALIIIGLVLVWLTGSDWANGGVRAGIGAFVAAVLVLIGFAVGRTQGFRGGRIGSLVLATVLILVVVGAAGIALQNPIHSLEGSAYASSQKFASAITEFNAAGNSLGVARTYNDWGENLLNLKQYSLPDDPTQAATDGALAKFNFVLDPKNGFTKSDDSDIQEQVTRAKNGVVNTVLAWGNAKLNQSPADYQGAVDRFKLVVDQKDAYSIATGFSQLHQQAAKAYYGLGKDQVASGDCTDAVATYQIVIKEYADTPQGGQASSDLKKPQNVTGKIVNRNTGEPSANAKLFLSGTWQLTSGFFSASDDYVTLSDANGKFTFTNIPTGDTKYLISYVGTTGQEEITVTGGSQPANVVVVSPLCGADAGTVAQF
jgi:tetratricopeptide (TPR) repeat protein